MGNPTGSSALRLCVWLFDDNDMKIFYMNQTFPSTFWTIEGIIYQNGVHSDSVSRFLTADGTKYPFFAQSICSDNLLALHNRTFLS